MNKHKKCCPVSEQLPPINSIQEMLDKVFCTCKTCIDTHSPQDTAEKEYNCPTCGGKSSARDGHFDCEPTANLLPKSEELAVNSEKEERHWCSEECKCSSPENEIIMGGKNTFIVKGNFPESEGWETKCSKCQAIHTNMICAFSHLVRHFHETSFEEEKAYRQLISQATEEAVRGERERIVEEIKRIKPYSDGSNYASSSLQEVWDDTKLACLDIINNVHPKE